VSCLLYDSSLLLPAPPDGATDAQSDAGAPETGCPLARWPRRPAIDDVAGGGTVEFVSAVRTLDYGLGRDGGVPRDFGFDLDGVCTCGPIDGVESCRTPPDASAHCDLDDGRDSTSAELLVTFAQVSPAFSQEAINDSLRAGYYGLLVRVRNYNGTPDDPNVEVAVFNSSGNDGVQDGGVPLPPREDGTDRWTVDPASLKGGIAPPYTPVYLDSNAYVANHRLVATLDFPVTFSGNIDGVSAVTIDLKGSVVVGTLVAEGSGYRIESGSVAGRWPTNRLLPSLEVLPDPFDSSRHLCGDSLGYAYVKELICDGQDIVTDLKQDNTTAPCDALSVSIGFTARPAALGDVVAPPARPKPCGPQWTDDCPR
jgi:hypothetical protein